LQKQRVKGRAAACEDGAGQGLLEDGVAPWHQQWTSAAPPENNN